MLANNLYYVTAKSCDGSFLSQLFEDSGNEFADAKIKSGRSILDAVCDQASNK